MLLHRVAQRLLVAVAHQAGRSSPGERPRVVILLGHAWGTGGTTRTCLNLAGHLARRHDVTVMSIVRYRDRPAFPFPDGVSVRAVDDQRPGSGRGPRSAVRSALRAAPSVLFLPLDRRMSAWASLWTDLLLLRAMWRLRADVVIGTRPALNVVAAGLARRGVVAVGQEHFSLATHGLALRTEIKRRFRGLAAVVTLTEGDRADYAAALGGATRVVCIPNAVPPLAGPPADLAHRTVVAVGRLTPQKGFDLLIPAFARVVSRHPDWTLRICGGGRERGALERLVASHELSDNVLLLGPVKRIEEQLAAASLFVLSSRFEGMPLALIEAMSKGLPVVAFDCPTGPRDVLDGGTAGVLVPAEDVDGLARAMLELVEDDSRRQQLGAAASERARAYSIEVIGRQWDDLLGELAHEHS